MHAKRLLAAALDSPIVLRALAPLREAGCAVLFLHRFAHPERGDHGIPPEALRAQLDWLRRHRVPLVRLGDVVERLRAGEPVVPGSVAYTIDDGYADFIDVGLPVFEEFDCPVSLFVTTGFLDGTDWMWWDRARHAVAQARGTSVDFDLAGERVRLELGESARRRATGLALVDRLERLPDVELRRAIEHLYAAADLEQPRVPPAQYAPMRWDDVRACRARGVDIAPHTVTHPILAHVDAETSRREIEESWRRVREEVPGALPVFAYPNGSAWAFTGREEAFVREAGLHAAVTTRPAYASALQETADAQVSAWTLPRFYVDAHLLRTKLVVSGVEELRRRWRARRHR
jgi:peptidoglycan/xylan/chitin deacetylase (PgdA/CDA1 family)